MLRSHQKRLPTYGSTTIIAGALCALMSGCGGGESSKPSFPQATQAGLSSIINNTAVFTNNRANYTIEKRSGIYNVQENVGGSGATELRASIQAIQFNDVTVNLNIGSQTQTISSTDLKLLIELYIAFFNRVPDADGLAYWISQLQAGQGIDRIAESFYNAAIQYPALTGYSATMSTAEFVRIIYRNALGRSGTTAPPDEDVQFWVNQLNSGRATKGSLVRNMLDAAHSFAGHATWGWVPTLMDNKYTVGHYFAAQQGLNYNTPEETIQKTMAIAAAVTPTDTTAAMNLVPVTPGTGPIDPAVVPPLPAVVPAATPLTMSCVDGASWLCSGNSIIRTDNGIALTRSGVQAYGRSTSDLASPIVDKTAAYGFTLASGGLAEIRIAKDRNNSVADAAVLLSNLGLSWDTKVERPTIIEIFKNAQGRTQLDANGALTFSALPASSDLNFFDYAHKGVAGTQAHYANNRYFPRSEPSRCTPAQIPCLTTETSGLQYQAGDWRNGGTVPDWTTATRVHGDGDVHSGNGLPDANGNVTILPGGSGVGVPFPGSKGYRHFDNWSLQYGNLGAWFTQDTVWIAEWGGPNEHNKNRRGIVAYGDVTDAASIPVSGTASYSGVVYGWYAPNATDDSSFFRGEALVNVNFATREVQVTIRDTATHNANATPVPASLQAKTMMGAIGGNATNYLTGSANNGTLKGGLSGRYFGPVVSTGTSGRGPAEIGGTFRLSNAAGAAVVAGFIARKQ